MPPHRPSRGRAPTRFEQALVVGQLEKIVRAPPGFQGGVRLGRFGEERVELRQEHAVCVVSGRGVERLVALHIGGQVPLVRFAQVKGIRAHEEVGLAGTECHPIDRQPAADHQRDPVVHGSNGRRLPLASRQTPVDDHSPGDAFHQPFEDVGLELPSLLPEHGDERGGRQRLTRVQHVELEPLRAALGRVGALEGHLAHDNGPIRSTDRRLGAACLIAPGSPPCWRRTRRGDRAGRATDPSGCRGAIRRLFTERLSAHSLGDTAPSPEEVDVVVDPDERPQVRPARPPVVSEEQSAPSIRASRRASRRLAAQSLIREDR